MTHPQELNSNSSKINLQKAKSYYKGKPCTISTMLGGIHQIHQEDVQQSREFLRKYWLYKKEFLSANRMRKTDEMASVDDDHPRTCLDVGSGIGRVSKNVLHHSFPEMQIDFLEPNREFCKEAMRQLPSHIARNFFATVGQLFHVRVDEEMTKEERSRRQIMHRLKSSNKNSGEEATEQQQDTEQKVICSCDTCQNGAQQTESGLPVHRIPEPYDLVWIQWSILYLDDPQLTRLLKMLHQIGCKNLIIKCNTTTTDREHIDHEDGSIIRSEWQVKEVLRRSGWKMILHSNKPFKGFENLFPVHTYGCVPA